ncbi:glycoside hydrolase family 3 C-terminal domain-containing protein [Vallitalea okinawensis]|uniref:glycoside hydrolase family 3 C-terminal domain-containing protein n=1 Tax=Vallitalea okinawensis TaxID=2078660 RepID=UPI000CFE2226|nr:glycoside hydrolase family 3 C-terminal domain-containing protein [Vallitalea okinawensis]
MEKYNYSFQDTELTLEERVNDLVTRLTLEEKISQMLHYSPAINRLGIPSYNWWNECLHGVARAGVATVFPQAIGMAASFDARLIKEAATVISDEARAKHHEYVRQGDRGIYKGLTFWSPNINIFRDPRWGRGHETYGEDPFLTGKLGVAFIQGLQGSDPKYLKVAACAKHFAVHSGPEKHRHSFDAIVSKKDLYETYLPAFEACVKEGEVEAVMGAYNRTNGEPCCGSTTLLNDILRDDWGFDGHVVSDCGAICDFHMYHKITETPQESAALAVNAGSDLNCGNTYAFLLSAIEQGLLNEHAIDRAIKRLFATRFRLGQFDPEEQNPYTSIPYELNDCEAHHELAKNIARRGMVLLKNEKNLLPLKKDKLNTIAIIGPNADDRVALLGNYNGTPSVTCTPLEGIRRAVNENTRVYYSEGCDIQSDQIDGFGNSTSKISEAVSVAERADVAVICVGLNPLIEGEAGDASNSDAAGDKISLKLPGLQNKLIEKVVATGTPTIVVVLAGSAMDLQWADQNTSAVIQAWYPGAEGGAALADLLFGVDDFTGCLPVTFVKSTEDLPDFRDYNMKGRTYRYIEKEPLYPFGYGLSYNDYSYSHMQVSSQTLSENQKLDVSVTVTNNGIIKGSEVIQVYIKANNPGIPVPHWSLANIEVIDLNPNDSKEKQITLLPEQFMLINEEGKKVYVPGEYTIFIGGSQPDGVSERLSGKKVLRQTIKLV